MIVTSFALLVFPTVVVAPKSTEDGLMVTIATGVGVAVGVGVAAFDVAVGVGVAVAVGVGVAPVEPEEANVVMLSAGNL